MLKEIINKWVCRLQSTHWKKGYNPQWIIMQLGSVYRSWLCMYTTAHQPYEYKNMCTYCIYYIKVLKHFTPITYISEQVCNEIFLSVVDRVKHTNPQSHFLVPN